MRYFALATDYDGTLAHHGIVSAETVDALHRLLDTGRRLVMVTGRELDELLTIFPEIDLFEWVVAENGALLYRPSDREEILLAERPPAKFVETLKARGVDRISEGRVIVATWEPYQTVVLETIRELGLELQVIFNKGAVMVLPAGVNKATGLRAALKKMGLSRHEVVGVGDAENDHAFVGFCECSVAVANALPALKERVTFVTRGDHGDGVIELIEELIGNDLADRAAALAARDPLLGVDDQGRPVAIAAYGPGILLAGPSGSGKSTTTTSLLERLVEAHYQFCIIDPEGDYDSFPFAVSIGSAKGGPSMQEVADVLARADQNLSVNLIGLRLSDRPEFFSKLLPMLTQQRAHVGRPHWLIVDEAHHLMPPSWEMGKAFAKDLTRAVFITVHPDQVHPAILESVGIVIAVGDNPGETLKTFSDALKLPTPKCDVDKQGTGMVTLWNRAANQPPRQVQITTPTSERHRHIRKYAEGELPPDRSFYFRGPENKLSLRAQNLILFLQIAEGVDDETWLFHLRDGGYSKWFRDCIKDEELARQTEQIESEADLDAKASREKIREAVERRYTLPTTSPRLAQDKDLTADPRS